MAKFLDTTGKSTLGIGICARCSRKFPIEELSSDPNYPNLMVCREDSDQYDPYRLAPRPSDKIILPFTRPDLPLNTAPAGVVNEADNMFIITENNEGYMVP